MDQLIDIKLILYLKVLLKKIDVNYKETFTLVFKMTAIRVLLFVGINHGWSLSQMDVKNTFLHTYLKENVFIKLPSGHLQNGHFNLVCQLYKSIYGLKQSPHV